LKFYYKERTAKNQCKVLSEEKGMLTIQMRNGGKFLVSKKSVLAEAKSEVKINVDSDMVRSLVRMVQRDTDSADKHALEYILWDIAEKIGIVDSNGNLKDDYKNI